NNHSEEDPSTVSYKEESLSQIEDMQSDTTELPAASLSKKESTFIKSPSKDVEDVAEIKNEDGLEIENMEESTFDRRDVKAEEEAAVTVSHQATNFTEKEPVPDYLLNDP